MMNITKKLFVIISLIIILLNLVFFAFMLRATILSFRFPTITDYKYFIMVVITSILPTIFSIIFIFTKDFMKVWVVIIAMLAIGISIVFSFKTTLFMRFLSPIDSQTEKIENYLKFDEFVEKIFSYDIFPKKIPKSAENIQYFYRFRDCVDEDYDVYLKISLPEDEFEKEKNRINNEFLDALKVNDEDVVEYQIKFEEGHDGYHYKIVRFNKKKSSITYIESYTIDNADGKIIPYFKEINV